MQIGSWLISEYTLRVLGGLLPGVLWVWIAGSRQGISPGRLSLLLWVVLTGTIIGGRCGYVAQHFEYFAQHPGDSGMLWRVGGIDGPSAWIGGLAATVLWGWHAHYPVRRIAGLLTPFALLLCAGAWWGCSGTGCVWGHEVTSMVPAWQRWLVREAPDIYRTFAPRYAVADMAAAVALGLGGVGTVWRAHNAGIAALYLAGMAGLTLLRADPAPLAGNMRLDTILYGVLALSSGFIEAFASRRTWRCA